VPPKTGPRVLSLTDTPLSRTIRIGVLGLAVTAALAGCGGDDAGSRASKALGAESSRDESRLQDWFRGNREIPHTYARLVRAMTQENIAGARRQIDRLAAQLQRSQDRVLDFDSSKMRRILGDYVATLTETAASADRLISLAEEEQASGYAIDPSRYDDAVADFQRAAMRTQAADRDLLNRLSDGLSPEQRSRFNEAVRKYYDQLEAEAGQ
jgi:hypothetical protein